MPTIDELHAADKQHAEAIADIKDRLTGHDIMLARHEANFGEIRQEIGLIRENMARVATKDDISALRQDISNNYAMQLAAAQSAIPARVGAWVGVGGFLLALAGFAASHFK